MDKNQYVIEDYNLYARKLKPKIEIEIGKHLRTEAASTFSQHTSG